MADLIHVESYYQSLIKKNEELCGDRVRCIRNDNSFLMVLADGLGSGVKANILATLTTTILSELMTSKDISLEEAVETVTNTLPQCKERGIAYSTFAILQVFYDGKAKLIEFDTPVSILIRAGKNENYSYQEHYIGSHLIREANFILKPDDYMVLFSDGILHAGLGSILNFGWDRKDIINHIEKTYRPDDSALIMTRTLLAAVNDLYNGAPGDDSTVAVAKVVAAKEAVVMVGPPCKQEDDAKVVASLMQATGKKIVCGGTTSQIVARFLDEDITIDELSGFENDVPPGGKIKGIDLVTEGVLTLQKVGSYLKECAYNQEYYDNFILARPTDRAIEMSLMFLKECTAIRFIVGTANNPAHSQLAYSTISINGKIKLIERIANYLKLLGKIVKIELY